MNRFSETWCNLFLAPVPREQTVREVAFVARQLPLPQFTRVIDVACGMGRHCRELSASGYAVTGVDQAPALIERAREACPACELRVLDMRELASIDDRFDGALSLWHSFGYFDDPTNEAILRELHAKLRPGGRLILDIYNREHASRLPAVEWSQRAGVSVEARRSWQGSRWRVVLAYDGVVGDEFEWRLYSPDEIRTLAEAVGFSTVCTCAWFDEAIPASAAQARMQLVFERGS